MNLTKPEQSMFDGEQGEGYCQSMEILVALGKIYGAKKLIPISSAQIAGVSYKTIGGAGLEYLEALAKTGVKVKVRSLLNPAGMDREQWQAMGVPKKFAEKQLAIMKAYESMGIQPTYTCTPYLVGLRPKAGEHVAWSESSAVAFCNSVLDARTNREGGPSALAAAVCGVTPAFGMHLDENRKASIVFEVGKDIPLALTSDFGLLGMWAGKKAGGKIPAFVTTGAGGGTGGVDREEIRKAGSSSARLSESQLKALGAAMAAAGNTSLFFWKGATPKFTLADEVEKIPVEKKELLEIKAKLQPAEAVDLVTLGCPHFSLDEFAELAKFLKGKKVKKEVWVCCARTLAEQAEKAGYAKVLRDAGVKIVCDTCMVVSPIDEMGHKVTAANSGKAVTYLPGLCKQKPRFGSIEEIVECE